MAMSVFGHIDDIEILVRDNQISNAEGFESLTRANFAALKHWAGVSYEKALVLFPYEKVTHTYWGARRAECTHVQKRLTKSDTHGGVDTLTPSQYWEIHFSSTGSICKLKSDLENFINEDSSLKDEISNLKAIEQASEVPEQLKSEENIDILEYYLHDLSQNEKNVRSKILGYIDWRDEVKKEDFIPFIMNKLNITEQAAVSNINSLFESGIILETDNYYLANNKSKEFKQIYKQAALTVLDDMIQTMGLD